MKPRVCFVINQLGGIGSGGSDRVVSVIANELASRGWEVDICALTDDRTIGRELDQNVGTLFLRRIPFGNRFLRVLGRIFGGILLVADYRRKYPDAVIVSFIAWVNICSTLASIGRTGSLVLSERTDPAVEPSHWVAKKLRDLCYRLADHIVFQTPDAQEYFGAKIRETSSIIPNPVSADLPTWNIKTRSQTIAAASRLEAQKNIPLLLRAFARFQESHPEHRLLILGDGKQRSVLENLVRELNLTDNVEFSGHVDDVHRRLRECKLFVLSSDYEGMPNALLEAMCMGMPVISTDCRIGGPRMLIEDGTNGKLVPVGDYRKLALAMCEMVDRPEESRRMGEQAAQLRTSYSRTEIVSKWESLIEKLTGVELENV